MVGTTEGISTGWASGLAWMGGMGREGGGEGVPGAQGFWVAAAAGGFVVAEGCAGWGWEVGVCVG